MARAWRWALVCAGLVLIVSTILLDKSGDSTSIAILLVLGSVVGTLYWNLFNHNKAGDKLVSSTPTTGGRTHTGYEKGTNASNREDLPDPMKSDIDIPLL